MARIKATVNDTHQKLLIDEVFKKFGSRLTHSHQCEKLSHDIKQATKKNIGANTVRRALGFLKTAFSTSLKTLDIFSEYAGYDNWSSFTEQADRSKYEPLSLQTESDFYSNFYKIDMREEADMNYHNACRNIALRILFNNALLEQLGPTLAKNPISQIYFYERFPFIDGLGSNYKKHLRFYLHHKPTEEAKLFGNTLLFLSAFLCDNQKELKNYYNQLNQVEIHDQMHPFVIARYLGSNTLYAYKKNLDMSEWLKKIFEWDKFFHLKKNISFWRFPYFQYMICDYLNLAGEFENSLKIINTSKPNNKYEVEEGYTEGLEIIYNISKHVTAKHNFINWCADSTNALSRCNPLFKKYYTLQILCALQTLLPNGRKKEKIRADISTLINDTGFVFFKTF